MMTLAMALHASRVENPEVDPVVVYGIAQDQQDFLWLAAEFDGLLRFDGQQYLRFVRNDKAPKVSYSQVVSDSSNQLWIGTWGQGLWLLDSKRKQWQQVAGVPNDARIQTLWVSANNRLWIGTTQGLYQLDPSKRHAEPWPALAHHRIWQIAEANHGVLWIATSDGLYRLTPDDHQHSQWFDVPQLRQQEIRTLAVQGEQLLVGIRSQLFLVDASNNAANHALLSLDLGNANTIAAESDASWLVGSIDGLFRISRQGQALQSELLYPAVDVRRIFQDQRQKVWLATRNNGLMPLAPAALTPIRPEISAYLSPSQPHRLGPPSVTTTRWIPLENSLLQLKDGQWQTYKFRSDTPVAYVRDVVEFGPHTLAATDQGLFRLNHDQVFVAVPLNLQLPRFNIERMAIAADGALWLGLWEQGVLRIDGAAAQQDISRWQAVQMQPQLQAQEGIIDIRQDAQQRLWLLSRQGKLYQADANSMQLRWQVDPALGAGYFQCMLPVDDMLWLCTDRGLLRLHQDLSVSTMWGVAAGLPDQRVIGIARTEHLLWVLTRNGLLSVKPDGSQLHLLEARPGVELSRAQLNGLMAMPNDQVQVATSHGIWQVRQSDMTAVPNDMQLHLTTLRLNQQLFSIAGSNTTIELPDLIQELQLQFKLLTYQPHLKVRYFFRWHPQTAWTDLGQDATLTLSQLSAGIHQLEVMAQAGGQQIVTQPIRLQVPTPFWQQPAGLGGLAVLSILSLWGLYHLRMRHLEQRAQVLNAMVSQRTAELQLANQQLQRQSNTDSLTGLLNRRALYAAMQLLQGQRNRSPSPLTLVLMDIDHFKTINDHFGHDVGDAVLRNVAAYLKKRLRGQDLIARWGGEEFLLLMPETDLPQALPFINELRQGIQQLAHDGLPGTVTATFGISTVSLTPDALDQAVKVADKALYQGKAQGRNQVVQAPTIAAK